MFPGKTTANNPPYQHLCWLVVITRITHQQPTKETNERQSRMCLVTKAAGSAIKHDRQLSPVECSSLVTDISVMLTLAQYISFSLCNYVCVLLCREI